MGLLRRLRHCNAGAIEIEHALITPVLVLLVLATIETGFSMISQQSIENGVRLTTAKIRESLRTGSAFHSNTAAVKASICEQATIYLSTAECVSRIKIDLRALPWNYAASNITSPIKNGTVDTSGWVFNVGQTAGATLQPGHVVLLRAALEVPFTLKWLNVQFNLGNIGNGNRLLIASEIFPTYKSTE